MSTIKELEDQLALAYAATNQRTGQRVSEYDLKFRRDMFALQVKIEELKAAEVKRPQINVDQLKWLGQLQGATDKDGNRLYKVGSTYQQRVDDYMKRTYEGQDLSAARAAIDKNLATAGASIGPAFSELTAQQRQGLHEAGVFVSPPGYLTGPLSSIEGPKK